MEGILKRTYLNSPSDNYDYFSLIHQNSTNDMISKVVPGWDVRLAHFYTKAHSSTFQLQCDHGMYWLF